MRKLLLSMTTLLAALPLAITQPAGADGPPPPGEQIPCMRTVTVDNPSVREGTAPFEAQLPTPMTFTVTTTGCVAGPAVVAWHANDRRAPYNDFPGQTGILSWPAGNGDPKTITIGITPDSTVELDERADLLLCFDTARVQQPRDPGGHGVIVNDDPGRDPQLEAPPIIDFVCK